MMENNQNNKTQIIIKSLAMLGEYYDKVLTNGQMRMYAEDLSELSLEDLTTAIKKYRIDPTNKFFPLPAQLIALVKPVLNEQDIGIEISSKIIQAVSKFGSHRTEQAKEFLGEHGWEVIKRSGGWENLCQELNEENRGMLTAQMRELAKTVVKIKTKENYEIKNNPALENKTVDVKNLLANLSFGEIK